MINLSRLYIRQRRDRRLYNIYAELLGQPQWTFKGVNSNFHLPLTTPSLGSAIAWLRRHQYVLDTTVMLMQHYPDVIHDESLNSFWAVLQPHLRMSRLHRQRRVSSESDISTLSGREGQPCYGPFSPNPSIRVCCHDNKSSYSDYTRQHDSDSHATSARKRSTHYCSKLQSPQRCSNVTIRGNGEKKHHSPTRSNKSSELLLDKSHLLPPIPNYCDVHSEMYTPESTIDVESGIGMLKDNEFHPPLKEILPPISPKPINKYPTESSYTTPKDNLSGNDTYEAQPESSQLCQGSSCDEQRTDANETEIPRSKQEMIGCNSRTSKQETGNGDRGQYGVVVEEPTVHKGAGVDPPIKETRYMLCKKLSHKNNSVTFGHWPPRENEHVCIPRCDSESEYSFGIDTTFSEIDVWMDSPISEIGEEI